MFPYSLVVLCWHGLAQRTERMFKPPGMGSSESMEFVRLWQKKPRI